MWFFVVDSCLMVCINVFVMSGVRWLMLVDVCGGWLLVVVCGLFVVCCWLVLVGCWLLVVGCWRLVVPFGLLVLVC